MQHYVKVFYRTVYNKKNILVCRFQADICFVVDSSGSINDRDPQNWQRVKEFMKNIVDRLEVGLEKIRISVVTFSNRGNVEFYLNDYKNNAEVKNAIDGINYAGGTTNTSGGIWKMREDVFSFSNGDRSVAPNMAIAITDGKSTQDTEKTIPFANDAKNQGIKILAVGVTDAINMEELEGIASSPIDGEQTVFTVADFDRLAELLDSLFRYICITQTTTTVITTPALKPVLGKSVIQS